VTARRARLVYVVGPSGAGKDSLLLWVRERLPAAGALAFARRTITRPAAPHGEQHEPASEAQFAARLARGEFVMHWEANGHRYGIGREIVVLLEQGVTVVVNGSRAHLRQARLAFPDLDVVHITAPPALRSARLAQRAREAPAAVRERLAREIPVARAALELVNDRALHETGARLLRYLLG